MTNSETKNFSQNASLSYHLGGKCSNGCKKDSLNVPKLRFKGYNEEWKHYRLKDIVQIYDGTHQTPNYIDDGIKFVSVENINNLDKTNKYISREDYEKDFKIKPEINDILMTRIGDIGTPAIINTNERYAYYVSLALLKSNYAILAPKFLIQRISSEQFQHELWKRTLHVAFPKKINKNEIGECNVYIPHLPEQEKIASFLTLIDKKIGKQKELVELLKKYKRGLLSQIFSQKLRFKDKNGNDYQEWEECKFDEIFQILGNNTLSRECLNYTNIGVKNIHYGDILVKYHTCINDEIDKIPNINSDINLNKIPDDNYLTVGDVILADTAEDYTVGKTCEIVSCNTKILSGLHTIPCRPKRNFAKGYLGYYLNSAEYHDKLIPLITGIKVSSISKKEIKKTIIKYPVYNEQKKIANLLLLIENKLNLNIKRLELFETYKKGLLQQLFI